MRLGNRAVNKRNHIDEQMCALGLEPQALNGEQKRQLDEDVYLLLESAIGSQWLDQLREAFDLIHASAGTEAGKEVAQIKGVRRLADLVNKDAYFDAVYLYAPLLAAVHHVLKRPFKLHSLNGHNPLKGSGLQPLHSDTGQECIPSGPYHVVNSMWMLDDFTAENCATRVVPRSHLKADRLGNYVEDGLAGHPEQIHLLGKAGTIAIFNGNVWHSSCISRSGAKRRTLPVHLLRTSTSSKPTSDSICAQRRPPDYRS